MNMSALLTVFSVLILHSFSASALKPCGYNRSPKFCNMEQYFQCRGVKDSTFDAILRLKTIGSNPYLMKGNGDAIGLLRFEYQVWANFDDGFKYYASEKHHRTGRRYENGAYETNGPQATSWLYDSQFGPIKRKYKNSEEVRGLIFELQRETDIVRGNFDYHYFLLHAVPERNFFHLYWYSFDSPYNSLKKNENRRIEKSVCQPVTVKK